MTPPVRKRKHEANVGGSPGSKSERNDDDTPGPGLVVGIGASAGGLDAFKTFFANMPSDRGMAFVLVQHLSPDHKSMLADLVGKVAAMPVMEAEDGMAVTANRVYVIPPDATLTIKDRTLRVVTPAPPREHRRPIDTFLSSLADDQGENAVCIILSGTGSDGTLGLTAIKERGGLTLAQAEFDHSAMSGMPHNAAATGLVDHVMPVDKMPAKLSDYAQHLSHVASRKDGDGIRNDTTAHLASISTLLRTKIGHDFGHYKEKTVVRRIQRRMQVLQLDTVPAYITRLREEPRELELLFRELLIGVTQFFRDPHAFEALQVTVLPKLLEGKGAGDQVRIWVPACATGEEVYSIAILVKQAMELRGMIPNVQIFGTDIDESAVAVARAGRYRKPLTGVTPERVERWFVDDGADRCPIKAIREMCVFSTHSLIKDPPFSKLDLISCRNLLIYFDAELQDRVMRTFHYALRPGGALFLGSSESLSRSARLFDAFDKKNRIFHRRDAEAVLPELAGAPAIRLQAHPAAAHAITAGDDRIDRGARRALERYSPVYVVIDKHHQILRFSGSEIGRYIGPSPGTASLNLFDILRKPLRSVVRAAIQTISAAKEPVVHNNVALKIEGKSRNVTVIVAPVPEGGVEAGHCVVAFHDAGPLVARKDARSGDDSLDLNVQALEQELRTTKTQLQAAVDEFEITNEEMKSANEEYQSVNEELQSSNEELETSKEEMQSINEELQTINSEMTSKNELLGRLNSDLKNLFESTEIATIFLDGALRIKSFTPGMTDLFRLRDADVGRPVTEIVTLLNYADLERDAKAVIRKLSIVERDVEIAESGASYIMRIRPYRTVDNILDGVVMTFVDVTERRNAEKAERDTATKLRVLADNIPILCWTADAEGSIFWYNNRWYEYTGTTFDTQEGWGWTSVHDPEELPVVLERWKASIASGQPFEMVFPLKGKDGLFRPFLTRIVPLRDEGGRIINWFGTHTDITNERNAENALRENEARLQFMLDSAQLGDWDLDLISDTSQRSLRHDQAFGYTEPIEDWGFKTFIQHVHPEDRSDVERLFRDSVTRQKDWHVECRIVWPHDGGVRWISVHGSIYRAVGGTPTRMLGIVTDITERKQVETQTALLMGELDHRVKNILAIVSAIILQTLKTTASPGAFAANVEGRITAIAKAHSLLTQQGGRVEASLRDLITTELAPYDRNGGNLVMNRAVVDVALTPKAGLALALAVHELTSNAAKYGALSTPVGRLAVSWEIADSGDNRTLNFTWTETGGPAVQPPTRRGFGTTLIERTLSHEFEAKVTREFRAAGLCCTISLPLTDEVGHVLGPDDDKRNAP